MAEAKRKGTRFLKHVLLRKELRWCSGNLAHVQRTFPKDFSGYHGWLAVVVSQGVEMARLGSASTGPRLERPIIQKISQRSWMWSADFWGKASFVSACAEKCATVGVYSNTSMEVCFAIITRLSGLCAKDGVARYDG